LVAITLSLSSAKTCVDTDGLHHRLISTAPSGQKGDFAIY
jgi:hypothetical protein